MNAKNGRKATLIVALAVMAMVFSACQPFAINVGVATATQPAQAATQAPEKVPNCTGDYGDAVTNAPGSFNLKPGTNSAPRTYNGFIIVIRCNEKGEATWDVSAVTPTPRVSVPTRTALATAMGQYEMTIAGADFFARGVADENDINNEGLTAGWMRITEAGNRDYCAWSNQFKMEISTGVAAQIPHCLEWRLTGTGNVRLTFKPDSTRNGYATSDTLGTGLAWWPSGNNGSYRVTRGSTVTEWIPLTTGPEGVNFPKNGGQVVIEFKLENGFVTMPLGEIRNNVQPKY